MLKEYMKMFLFFNNFTVMRSENYDVRDSDDDEK